MFDVIASCCAREYQRVCVCVSPRFAVFLILCQCLCVFKCASEWVHPPAFVFICLFVCSYVYCTCLVGLHVSARLFACICARPLCSLCVCVCVGCVCVFPWGFRVSLRGLVFLIRLGVWRHDYRVGLHHGDPGTNWGQSLLSHSCEEGEKENGGRRWPCFVCSPIFSLRFFLSIPLS